MPQNSKRLDLTGQRYGRLTVIRRAEQRGQNSYWFCQCDCGNTTEAQQGSLRNGTHKSCGCLTRELTAKRFTKHGHSPSRKAAVRQANTIAIGQCASDAQIQRTLDTLSMADGV